MNVAIASKGWADLEQAFERLASTQRRAVADALLAQTLRDCARAPAFKSWREGMRDVGPGSAGNFLESLPVQTRADLSARLSDYRAPRPGVLRRVRTNGSSGQPLELVRNAHEADIEREFVNSAWLRMGMPPGAKGAVLVGRELPEGDHKVAADGMVWISCLRVDEVAWERVTELLEIYRPKYIRGYGSIVGAYFSYLFRSGTEPASVSAAAYSSDSMLPNHRSAVASVLGTSPIGLYGQAERAVMAVTCEYSDEYHVFDTYGRMELLDDTGKPISQLGVVGDVAGTSLWPRATAIVRYTTGDRASWASGPCRCGRTQPRFKLLAGRTRDVLVDSNGVRWVFGPAIYEAAIYGLPSGCDIQFFHPEPGALLVRVSKGHAEYGLGVVRSLENVLRGTFRISVANEEPVRSSAGKRLLLDLPSSNAVRQ